MLLVRLSVKFVAKKTTAPAVTRCDQTSLLTGESGNVGFMTSYHAACRVFSSLHRTEQSTLSLERSNKRLQQ